MKSWEPADGHVANINCGCGRLDRSPSGEGDASGNIWGRQGCRPATLQQLFANCKIFVWQFRQLKKRRSVHVNSVLVSYGQIDPTVMRHTFESTSSMFWNMRLVDCSGLLSEFRGGVRLLNQFAKYKCENSSNQVLLASWTDDEFKVAADMHRNEKSKRQWVLLDDWTRRVGG
jgi:hypothetical protein